MTRPVAIVTGGNRGIGLACVDALAAGGFDIIVADIAEAPADELKAVVDHHEAEFRYCISDISNLDSHAAVVSSALDAFHRIDCLVNNAGIASPVRGDLLHLEPANFDKVLDLNLRGTVFLTQAVVNAMLRYVGDVQRTIINVTSISAEYASPERADYCISKAGLSMWTKVLALRLAAEGIPVFEVRPGIVRTEMTASASAKYDALIANGLVPMRRWGEAHDIGDAVAALASGRMAFATGSVLNLDGGLAVPRL